MSRGTTWRTGGSLPVCPGAEGLTTGWRVARLALHARHKLAIGSPRWAPPDWDQLKVRGKTSGAHHLDRAPWLLQAASWNVLFAMRVGYKTNVGPPAPLFAPPSQLIGRLPAGPTGANCPLRKLGHGPPFSPPHSCRTHDHEGMLMSWSIGGMEKGPGNKTIQ